jgi:hypothetical protein
MRKVFIILITICGLIILFWQNRGCESNTLSPPFSSYSETLGESREKGVFEFEVVLYKSNLRLDSGLVLKLKDAWVENSWSKQALVIGKTLIKKNDGHQLILNLDVDENAQERTNNFYYFLGNKPIGNHVHYNCDRIDTIRIPIYKESWPKLSSKKVRKAFDSLTFVRRQISR